MKTFDELIKLRRSIRKYQEKPVPKEIIKELINDCTLAPSSGNEQPWKFIIISDKVLLKNISDDCKKSLLLNISKVPQHPAKKYEAMLSNDKFNILYNAPTLVYIVGDKNLKNTEINCTLAASYFMLSAANEGLGTCWIHFAKFINDEKIKKLIGLDESMNIVAPIIVGYPQDIPPVPKRKPVEIIKSID